MSRPSSALDRRAAFIILAVAIILGTYARFNILKADFPFNDGGMFYVMTLDLQDNGYRLPATTTYNFRDIPYAYPPFSFYFTGLASDFTGISVLELVRILPALFNILSIPATYVLAENFLKSRWAAAVAALIFALIPNAFDWNVMGGGLTRSPGNLFAILAVDQAIRMYEKRERRYVATTAILCALTVLSHAQMAQLALTGIAMAFLFRGINRVNIIHSAIVVAGVVVLTFPWWGAMLSMHGLQPLLEAASAAPPGLSWEDMDFPLSTRLDIFIGEIMRYTNVIPILGMVKLLFDLRWMIPAWFLANIMIAPRAATSRAGVIVSIAAAVAIGEIIVPLIVLGWHRLTRPRETVATMEPVEEAAPASPRLPGWLKPALVIGVGLVLSVLVILAPRNYPALPTGYRYYTLSPASRQAMEWISQYTLPTCRFVTVGANGTIWGRDAIQEWFPVLAKRLNVTTVQGTEWLTNPGIEQLQGWRAGMNRCGQGDESCLAEWQRITRQPFTHVFIESPERLGYDTSRPLRESLRQSPNYSLIYARDGIDIFARRDATCPATME